MSGVAANDDRARPAAPRPRRGRPFQTVDALILIAAVGLGIFVSCEIEARFLEFPSWRVYDEPWRLPPEYGPGRGAAGKASEAALLLANLSAPVLAALSLALIPIQALPPRDRRLRRSRLPGTVAARAAALALLYVVVCFAIKRFAGDPMYGGMGEIGWALDVALAVNCLPPVAGLAIVSAWTTLLAARRWRPEPSWIDRLGRIVAVVWIAAGLFSACYYLVFRFTETSASMIIWN